jgi:spore coat protein A
LLRKVWEIRFSNTLPWALDPTNNVLLKALNVDPATNPTLTVPVLGVRLNPALLSPANQVGFVLKPDGGSGTTFSVKAGQTPWPMLGPLGTKFKDGSDVPVTTLWGYGNADLEHIFTNGGGLGVTFPARSFVVQQGAPITVNWYNNLVDGAGGSLPHLVGVDQTISMQTVDDSVQGRPQINGVPIAVHHHGGNNPFEYDGGPDQWFTPQRRQVGPGISSRNSQAADHLTYVYKNTDEASMHWYHDHGEGVTRINAYAGLAGLFVLRDANENTLVRLNLLPSGEQEVPVVIQDKVFQANGQLAYTGDSPAFNGWNPAGATRYLPGFGTGYDPNDENTVVTGTQPTHTPEMFGDVIVVNGMAWPNLQVDPRQYRLRLLNGSDSRIYNLSFGPHGSGLRFFQVGTDVGLLNFPVPLTEIAIAPGERKDIVIDFTPAKGRKVVLLNNASFPFPFGDPTYVPGDPTNPDPANVARGDPWATIMQFDVKAKDTTGKPDTRLTALSLLRGRAPGSPPVLPLINGTPKFIPAGRRRQIMLAEGCDEYGRIMPLLGTVAEGTKTFHDGPDIFPKLGTWEVWEFWNSTVDAHPIHMHLVRFRVADRQAFTGDVEAKTMSNGWTGVKFSAPPVLSGPVMPAPRTEQGWKDTVVCMPGEVTRVIASFDQPGKYVYHCHILAHEEHDMMRWFEVTS